MSGLNTALYVVHATSFCAAQTFPCTFIKAEQLEPRTPAACQTHSTLHGYICIHFLTLTHICCLGLNGYVDGQMRNERRDKERVA